MEPLTYRRALLKLSGEALSGDQGYGIDPGVLQYLAEEISEVHGMGAELALVIGGGNIFRGSQGWRSRDSSCHPPTTWACWQR